MSDDLHKVLVNLERAATDVSRLGASTGPQWTKLTAAILHARAALSNYTTNLKE